jgi:hypothetical protein
MSKASAAMVLSVLALLASAWKFLPRQVQLWLRFP